METNSCFKLDNGLLHSIDATCLIDISITGSTGLFHWKISRLPITNGIPTLEIAIPG